MVRELSDKHLRAINAGRKKVGLKPIRRKKGTTKGEVRKTARRAFEPKKKSTGPKVTKAGKLDQRSAIPDSVMARAIENGLNLNTLPRGWYLMPKREKYLHIRKYL